MDKKTILLMIAAIAAMILLQREFLIPVAKDVATQSDLFLIESKDKASMFPVSNDMTVIAFQQCNAYAKTELGENAAVKFAEKPLNVWSLGNYEYVVNSEITAPDGLKKYACRITYKNGDDTQGAKEAANWSLDGLSGLQE